jgi:hypothetical protein
MFRCMKWGCPWHCGTRRIPSCAESMMLRGLAWLLSLGLLGSVAHGCAFDRISAADEAPNKAASSHRRVHLHCDARVQLQVL